MLRLTDGDANRDYHTSEMGRAGLRREFERPERR